MSADYQKQKMEKQAQEILFEQYIHLSNHRPWKMLLILFLFLPFEERKKKKKVFSKLRQSLGVAKFYKSMEKHKPRILQISFRKKV